MEIQEKIGELQSLALLHHLSDAKLAELAPFLEVRPVAGGTVLFEEGSPGDGMYFLSKGHVRIEKKIEAGGFKELALLAPGDFFGEMAIIEETPRSAQAVAVTDSVLFALSRPDLERWLGADPRMALGFFVELLRVLSHRLRRTSEQLVLLYDLSHLTLLAFEDEVDFLQAVLRRMLPHLEGDWTCAGYLYSEYNDDVTRVATEGSRVELLPETILIAETESRWLDETSFCVVLPGRTGRPLGFLVAHSELPIGSREKAEYEVALTAAAHLLAAALQNIKYDTEERLRGRLEEQRAYGTML